MIIPDDLMLTPEERIAVDYRLPAAVRELNLSDDTVLRLRKIGMEKIAKQRELERKIADVENPPSELLRDPHFKGFPGW